MIFTIVSALSFPRNGTLAGSAYLVFHLNFFCVLFSSFQYSSMTDESDFVLRWEIKNARATLAKGRAESAEFKKGGFKWAASVKKQQPYNDIEFTLRCDGNTNGYWKCNADVNVHTMQSSGIFDHTTGEPFDFDDTRPHWVDRTCIPWDYLEDEIINDKVIIEFRIRIISSERIDPNAVSIKFSSPNGRSDVILKIGDKKLHVSKEYLSIHSPVFEALFFGEFDERGKAEVEIKDVVYEEFLDLLQFIYPHDATVRIRDCTVQHIMKLADRFQIEGVFALSVDHLMRSKEFNAAKKLLLADQYRLTPLRDHCLKSFTSVADLHAKLKPSPEFANFSEGLKAAICERAMQLDLDMADDSFVLRFEMNNAAATLATGKAESAEFNEGGFRWTVGMMRRPDHPEDKIDFMLLCSVDHNHAWKCRADVGVWALYNHQRFNYKRPGFGEWCSGSFSLDEGNRLWVMNSGDCWNDLSDPMLDNNGTITLEFRISNMCWERGALLASGPFSSPNNRSDVVLRIGGRPIHVSKEYLSVHSPYFAQLFFGHFAVQGQQEVEMKDVAYEEFIDLLQLIYLRSVEITDLTVLHILKLADQFQIETVLNLSEKYLTQTSGFDVLNKLLLADKYGLVTLRDHCLQSFTSVMHLVEVITSSPEFGSFSGAMKIAICERIAML